MPSKFLLQLTSSTLLPPYFKHVMVQLKPALHCGNVMKKIGKQVRVKKIKWGCRNAIEVLASANKSYIYCHMSTLNYN